MKGGLGHEHERFRGVFPKPGVSLAGRNFLNRPAHMHRACLPAPFVGPGDGSAESIVHLEYAGTVAIRFKFATVARGQGLATDAGETSRTHIEQQRFRRWEFVERRPPAAAFDLSAQ